jgi:hypothetical protein
MARGQKVQTQIMPWNRRQFWDTETYRYNSTQCSHCSLLDCDMCILLYVATKAFIVYMIG